MSTLSAYFLSLKRLSEILPVEMFIDSDGAATVSAVADTHMGRLRLITNIESTMEDWLTSRCLPTLGELIAKDELKVGTFFTHYGPFYGKDIGNAALRYHEGKALKNMPMVRAKLTSFPPYAWLEIQAHPENYTTTSAVVEMSGLKRLFVVARVTGTAGGNIQAQAYVIGQLHSEPRQRKTIGDIFGRLPWQMEIFLPQIDSLIKGADVVNVTAAELKKLLATPETSVKHAFAEIIGEPFVPKDWGGEKSDLFTTQIRIEGQSVASAFAFKGPAKPKPLTVADLGKNGDQISRLFSEPADFVVFQHCHSITSAVRDHMRAFATRIGRLRPFALIDGANTVRVLKAYGKLGF